MPLEKLGLFDTPPGPREVRLSLATVGLLVAALILIVPFSDIRAREIDAFVPVSDTIMFLSDLIIASLLYAQASVFRSQALKVLASVNVFNALLIAAHALSFPGAFSPGGLLGGGVNTTAWLFVIRRAAFPIAVMLYVALKKAESRKSPATEQPTAGINMWILAAVLLAAAATMLVTVGHDLLPPLFLNRLDAIATNVDFVGIASLALYVAAMAALFRRPMSVLDVWLLVALSGFFAQMILNLASHDRFTVGFYFEYVLLVFATLVVLLALIDESNRLYVRLALATAARNREREARLVSIDAVAAAITDEVGQPLIATKLSASAGLSWLDRQKPDRSKAIESLRETIDAGDRTFEVIKRLRAALTSGSLSQFNLNDLVREAALLFERDLAAHKISLELALDDADLPMQGNRTKIQQVLSSLLANAIESVSAMPERARRVAIRSTLEGEKILLDISDIGVGILREKIDKIFDPFFTLSASGTGLGLSLARTIIEEHGGRLSVSSDKDRGTTFHLQMNCCRVAGKLHSSSSISEDAQVAKRPLTPVELNVFRNEATDLLTLISSELAALREAGHDQAWHRRSMELTAGIERRLSSLV